MEPFNRQLVPDEILEFIFESNAPEWFKAGSLAVLALYRHDLAQWGLIKATAKQRGVFPPDLEKAVDAHLVTSNGHRSVLSDTPPQTADYPPLPAEAAIDADLAASASLWLDEYCAYSRKWAPRAYEGFHEAVGLFVLSTAAARRVRIEFGSKPDYPSLYMALIARTSLFTKSTVADLGLDLLQRAGLAFLLADDDASPQAFLRALTLYVPTNFDDLEAEDREHLTQQLAFTAQRGWFYEEWGQHLVAMMRQNGFMAEFRSIVRRMDDHRDGAIPFRVNTISRGRDIIRKPYLVLLANATPADLQPFLHAQSPLWRDGYLARFAFACPTAGDISEEPFPSEDRTVPADLIRELQAWHQRLGVPEIGMSAVTNKKGRTTGEYLARRLTPLPETRYHLVPEVWEAYYAYDRALRQILRHEAHEDLDGSYARLPRKALRIAALLASLHDDTKQHAIGLSAWHRGQQIAEHWRRDLHRLMLEVEEEASRAVPDATSRGEQRLITILQRHGALTARDINRWTKIAHSDIKRHLDALTHAGVVIGVPRGKTTVFQVTSEESTVTAETDFCGPSP